MGKIRLATIGTSAIGERLLEAAAEVDALEYVGTFSRDEEKAAWFTERHGGTRPFASLDGLCACDDVDAVYVASPNAAHFAQALACVEAGKHVLVEKPLCANRNQAERLLAAADRRHVVALEAMRPVHDPAWGIVTAALDRILPLHRATLRFGKYSSRYDDLLAGRRTNIFDARLATGALMDIGIYCAESMCALFGSPDHVASVATLVGEAGSALTGGAIDGAGSALCTFDGDDQDGSLVVELAWSKVTQDLLPCQFEGERGTLTVDSVSTPAHATLRLRGKPVRGGLTAASSQGDVVEELALEPCANTMVHELRDFCSLIRGEEIDTMWGERLQAADALARFCDVSLAALDVTDEVRRQAGIAFPADEQEG